MIKNYALVNSDTSLVEKIVYWDGSSTITINDLPEKYELILIEDKPAMVWTKHPDLSDVVLAETIGVGSQGMTWNGQKFSQDINQKPVVVTFTTSGLSEI